MINKEISANITEYNFKNAPWIDMIKMKNKDIWLSTLLLKIDVIVVYLKLHIDHYRTLWKQKCFVAFIRLG